MFTLNKIQIVRILKLLLDKKYTLGNNVDFLFEPSLHFEPNISTAVVQYLRTKLDQVYAYTFFFIKARNIQKHEYCCLLSMK